MVNNRSPKPRCTYRGSYNDPVCRCRIRSYVGNVTIHQLNVRIPKGKEHQRIVLRLMPSRIMERYG